MKDNNLVQHAIDKALSMSREFAVLDQQSKADLFDTLGARVEDTLAGDGRTASFDARFNSDELTRGIMGDVGKRIFKLWTHAIFQIICKPAGDDKELGSKLLQALTGKEGGAAVIAGILVGAFGASPAVAAILATLFVKIFAVPVTEGICLVWEERVERALAS